MYKRPIGIYDSGIGGLTVFSKLEKLLPNENFLYFGDTANIPYGTKTKEELLSITRKIMKFFKEKNVKAVVMACNTTSAVAYNDLKNDCEFQLYPLIQIFSKEIAKNNVSKIGVLSTEATANSHAYKININKYNPKIEVFEHGCPKKWVEMVENNTQNLPENFEIISKNLKDLTDKNVEKIILGCTHYPYMRSVLTKITGKDIFIDPSEIFAKFIAKDVASNFANDKREYEPKFYVSSAPENFISSSKIFYNVTNMPQIVNFNEK